MFEYFLFQIDSVAHRNIIYFNWLHNYLHLYVKLCTVEKESFSNLLLPQSSQYLGGNSQFVMYNGIGKLFKN